MNNSRNFFIFFLTILFSFSTNNLSVAAIQPPVTDSYNGGRGTSFNTDWRFKAGDVTGADAAAFDDSAWRQLSVPHDYSIELTFNKNSVAGADGGYLDGGIAWYRKTFYLPQNYSGKRVTIQFEGIYMNSSVYINGTLLGTRPYGYTSFEYDLTPYMNTGTTKNVIAVRVNNNQPTSRWYSGTGVYRNVWLTATNPVHIAYCGTFVSTPAVTASNAFISAKTTVQNHSSVSKTFSVVTTIYDQSSNLVTTKVSSPITVKASAEYAYSFSYILKNPTLWSFKNPYLYNVRTQIVDNDRVLDNFNTTLGIRKFSTNPNTGFWLNDENVKMRGVCLHHDLGSLGAAQNYRALERQVEIMKSLGCNAIRTSHNPPAPALLEICDRLGLVVMDEGFDAWQTAKKTNDYHLFFDTWAQQDVQDWVRRDRNHPSVIMWSIGNEIPEQNSSTGTTLATNLKNWVRLDDTTRPVTQATFVTSYVGPVLDAVGWNYATGAQYDADHAANPTWSIFGSETASAVRTRGVYHFPPSAKLVGLPDTQCSSYDNASWSNGVSAESSLEIDQTRAYLGGQFIWTGFDYIGETAPYSWPAKNSYFGIVDMCGFPKDIYYFYQSQWMPKPMVHLLPHWNWMNGMNVPVWAYTNCDSVQLVVNGTVISTEKRRIAKPYHIEWNIPFVPGKVKAYAYKNGSIAAVDSVVTAGNPTQIELKSDRDSITANGVDLAFIETNIRDVNGTLVPDAANAITYNITGPGKIVAVDNGNSICLESFQATTRSAFNGKSLAIVKSTGGEGMITVTASTTAVSSNLALRRPCNTDSQSNTEFVNIALNKTATSDSYESTNPINAGNDGTLLSRWCVSNANSGHWWMVDLGSAKSLTGAEITWEKSTNVYQYKIEISNDQSSWTTVVDKTANSTASAVTTEKFSGNGRYVRITFTSAAGTIWGSFYEFKVFDGTTTTAVSSNIASSANDGSSSTAWIAADGNAGHSWSVDLGKVYSVNKTAVTWPKSGVAYKYKIDTSVDSLQWTTAYDNSSNTSTVQTLTNTFTTVSARYVRVVVNGGTSDANRAGLADFQVYNSTAVPIAGASVSIKCVQPICANCAADSAKLKPWINTDNAGWVQTDSARVNQGATVSFGTLSSDSTNWKWSGSNGSSATSAILKLTNVQVGDSGVYVAQQGATSVRFKLSVNPNTGFYSLHEAAVLIFPNPSNDGVFNIVNCKNGTLTVYNVNAEVVYNSHVEHDFSVLNLSTQPNGVYIVKLKSDSDIVFKKLIINN